VMGTMNPAGIKRLKRLLQSRVGGQICSSCGRNGIIRNDDRCSCCGALRKGRHRAIKSQDASHRRKHR
jgi:hypothetical protein